MLSRRGASRPGRLRQRVVLETRLDTPDGAGGFTRVWVGGATFAADIVPLRADEAEFGEGHAGRVTHRIIIRGRSDIASGDRLRLGARIFEIRAIHDRDEDGRYLTCLTRETGI